MRALPNSDYFADGYGRYWVITFLGCPDTLALIISELTGEDLDVAKDYVSGDGIGGLGNADRYGIFYVRLDAHWKAIATNGTTYDSMDEGNKLQAHSHLCQSFATYNFIYHSQANQLSGPLVVGAYRENSKKIASMLLEAFDGMDNALNQILVELELDAHSVADLRVILRDLQATGID